MDIRVFLIVIQLILIIKVKCSGASKIAKEDAPMDINAQCCVRINAEVALQLSRLWSPVNMGDSNRLFFVKR